MIYKTKREDVMFSSSKALDNASINDAVHGALRLNYAVGTLIGYYDDKLSIASVSEFTLQTLGYGYEEFMKATDGSLKKLFFEGENTFHDAEHFKQINGILEELVLTSENVPVDVHIFKTDAVDDEGTPVWAITMRFSWEYENLKLINKAINSGLWYFDCNERGEISRVVWSKDFRHMLGYTDVVDFPNELSSWSDKLHPDDYERSLKALNDAIEDKSGNTKYDIEYRVKLKSGEYQWFRAIGEIVRRKDGTAHRIAGVFVNIEERKLTQLKAQSLANENESLDRLIYSMARFSDRFSVIDVKNGTYRYYKTDKDKGPAGYNECGTFDEFTEAITAQYKTFGDNTPLKDLMSKANITSKLIDNDSVIRFEYCSNDEDIYKIATIMPVDWEDGVVSKVYMVSIDVTKEKEKEIKSRKALQEAYVAAEHASKAKTDFLSNMSHDIRTPMNAIVGLTAIAGANISNQDKVMECLGKITKSSRHLLGLINEILDMSHIESGKLVISEENFNLSELVDNMVTMTKPGMDEHHHAFEVHAEHIEHEHVCGDSIRLQQVFTNIISNAVKYTPDGGYIRFDIHEKPSGSKGLGCYEFSIEDNGIGMSKEFQKVMFEPFSRADDHRTSKVQGTGLGMPITRNIVNMMNGEIKVDSELNRGTKITVTVFLKLQEVDGGKVTELADLPVLVVDDDADCCESTAATLNEIGMISECVNSGHEALKRTVERHERKQDYFALIMDWKMPGMDGIETTRQIRKAVGPDVPIIVLTAYDYSEIEDVAKSAGVDAFIAKPLFRSRLTATLKQFVGGKDESEETEYINKLDRLTASDYSGKRILLAEDNELNREIAVEILSMTGVMVDTAENGQIAVDMMKRSADDKYDLVFMDIQMPVMDGYQAANAIRALPGQKGRVPIVAMTANAFAEDVMMAKNVGMNEHISKPLDMDRLHDVLRRWL